MNITDERHFVKWRHGAKEFATSTFTRDSTLCLKMQHHLAMRFLCHRHRVITTTAPTTAFSPTALESLTYAFSISIITMTCIRSTILLAIAVVLLAAIPLEAFAPRAPTTVSRVSSTRVFKKKEDLSYLETRDMTKEEMLELNKKNEDIMNMELSMMTGFSLVLSLPLLYLCWVAFFSD